MEVGHLFQFEAHWCRGARPRSSSLRWVPRATPTPRRLRCQTGSAGTRGTRLLRRPRQISPVNLPSRGAKALMARTTTRLGVETPNPLSTTSVDAARLSALVPSSAGLTDAGCVSPVQLLAGPEGRRRLVHRPPFLFGGATLTSLAGVRPAAYILNDRAVPPAPQCLLRANRHSRYPDILAAHMKGRVFLWK